MLRFSVQLEYTGEALSCVQKAAWWMVNTLRRQKPECVNAILLEFGMSRGELTDLLRRVIVSKGEEKLRLCEEDARLVWAVAKMIFAFLKIGEESLPGMLFKPLREDLRDLDTSQQKKLLAARL